MHRTPCIPITLRSSNLDFDWGLAARVGGDHVGKQAQADMDLRDPGSSPTSNTGSLGHLAVTDAAGVLSDSCSPHNIQNRRPPHSPPPCIMQGPACTSHTWVDIPQLRHWDRNIGTGSVCDLHFLLALLLLISERLKLSSPRPRTQLGRQSTHQVQPGQRELEIRMRAILHAPPCVLQLTLAIVKPDAVAHPLFLKGWLGRACDSSSCLARLCTRRS
ncbi:nucleoside diphosphate kinase 6 isoform X3 [Rhineura floridana]|uniref:nucleoside diphosphate kinase 6 isoform X3 n=1 Tax=Rhineura floridana TaxID=261503 RepID=UPI002AC7F40D|nr:nucleoside diphosphate kinase 6 isoform X3 [Rhineura floridana]